MAAGPKYYPYLRGRRHELAVIGQVSKARRLAECVVPIIEPVTMHTSDLRNAINAWNQRGRELVLIVNPRVGKANKESTKLVHADDELQLSTSGIRPGILIGRRNSMSRIQSLLAEYSTVRPVIVHVDAHIDAAGLKSALRGKKDQVHVFLDSKTTTPYREFFDGARVLLRDGFRRHVRNRDYPSDSSFDSPVGTFVQDGYNGFGDFAIVGDYFRDGGGPAHNVALHLTYAGPRKILRVRHLVSRDDPSWSVARRFLDSLQQLPAFLEAAPATTKTSAVDEFLDLLNAKRFPSLGVAKGLSIWHHLEVVVGLLGR